RRWPGPLRARPAQGASGPGRDRRAGCEPRAEGGDRLRRAQAEDPAQPLAVALVHDPHGARGAGAGTVSRAPARRRARGAGSGAVEARRAAHPGGARRCHRGSLDRRIVHGARIPRRPDAAVMSAPFEHPLLWQIGTLARRAGEAILEVYALDFDVELKDDRSPLTAADLAAQKVIAEGLAHMEPVLPLVSEEAKQASWEQRKSWARHWLVDPLDGTREFVKRNGEFTVNIALIEDHRPVLGVVLAPVTGDLYVAARGIGAWWQAEEGGDWERIGTRALARPATVAGSRSHGGAQEDALRRLVGEDHVLQPLGSSLKFCLLARGGADVYLRRGPTSEWDTAAAQCVLEEAGGAVLDLHGRPLRYDRGESLLNPEFIAVGDAGLDWPAKLRDAGLP